VAVPTGGPGLLKFTTIMLYVVVLSGLVLGVVKAGGVSVDKRPRRRHGVLIGYSIYVR